MEDRLARVVLNKAEDTNMPSQAQRLVHRTSRHGSGGICMAPSHGWPRRAVGSILTARQQYC